MPPPAFSFDGIVTWMINPNHFYIRLRSDEEQKCRMEYLLNGYLESDELEKPELYLKPDLIHEAEFGDVLEYSNFSRRCSEELDLHLANDEEIEENDVEPMLKTVRSILLFQPDKHKQRCANSRTKKPKIEFQFDKFF